MSDIERFSQLPMDCIDLQADPTTVGIPCGDCPLPPEACDPLKAGQRIVQLEQTADYDPLTNLRRPEAYQRDATRLHGRATRDGMTVVTSYIDIDSFKPVNDTFGHEVGNLVIRAAAEGLRQGTRPGDIRGRIGGDEFGVTYSIDETLSAPRLSHLGANLKLAVDEPVLEVIQQYTEEPQMPGGERLPEASVGMAIWGPDMTYADAIQIAESNMYGHKERHGGGR